MAVPVIAGLGYGAAAGRRAGRALGGLLRQALLRHHPGAGRADLRQLGGDPPAGGGQPAAGGRLGLADRAPDAALPGRGAAAGQGGGRPGARPRPGSPPATSGCSWSAPAPGTPPRAWTSCWPATWAWPPDTQRLFVGHMGCYAALPGLGAASDFVAARGRPALLLCAELTSLHVQPPARGWTPSRSSRTRSSPTPRSPPWSSPAAGGYARARGRLGHRHLHRRPHDLGRHRPRLPDGAVAAGAGGALPRTSGGLVDELLARHGLRRRRGGRLGGAPGRPAHPRRGGAGAGAAAGRRWRPPGPSWPSTATARRRRCC